MAISFYCAQCIWPRSFLWARSVNLTAPKFVIAAIRFDRGHFFDHGHWLWPRSILWPWSLDLTAVISVTAVTEFDRGQFFDRGHSIWPRSSLWLESLELRLAVFLWRGPWIWVWSFFVNTAIQSVCGQFCDFGHSFWPWLCSLSVNVRVFPLKELGGDFSTWGVSFSFIVFTYIFSRWLSQFCRSHTSFSRSPNLTIVNEIEHGHSHLFSVVC